MSHSGNFIFAVALAMGLSAATPAIGQITGDALIAAAPPSTFPAWAYPWDPKFDLTLADDVMHGVPGSTAAFSVRQARDSFLSPDWHPQDHPPMPDIVARGRRPDVHACGSCHRASGTGGGPSVANLAGLPAAYIVQQLADFKSGARRFSGPPRVAMVLMLAVAKKATDAEIRAAADYFSALQVKPSVGVVETAAVPKTHVARHFLAISTGGEYEPIGQRIVEVPVDIDNLLLRDSRAQFTAYVPMGSVAKGESLVKTGDGKTAPCAGCHGLELKGVGPIPRIAGNSPTYLFRQLYDFQNNARAGVGSVLMKPVVEKLSIEDMVSIAAYLASLSP